MKKGNWRKYTFEFMSIFIVVISAFALNNWNDNRRDSNAETKILIEMSNGLNKDLSDIDNNIGGHVNGIKACGYWRDIINDKNYDPDSLKLKYFSLLRGYYPVQNKSGFETLRSKGLELIENDSLRFKILEIYDYYYHILRNQEENSYEMQFEEQYSNEINKMLSKSLLFDTNGNIVHLKEPIDLTKDEKNLFLTYLLNIEVNRKTMINYYKQVENKIELLRDNINDEIER